MHTVRQILTSIAKPKPALKLLGLILLPLAMPSGVIAQAIVPPPVPATGEVAAGHFIDVTKAVHVDFHHIAGHTAKKYLLETMGSGAAVFDFDNDGLLDIFLPNGAPIADSELPGFKPAKDGPASYNRLFHQKKDGTFEDVTEKAGLKGIGYSLGVAVGDYDNDGYEDLYVTGFDGNHLNLEQLAIVWSAAGIPYSAREAAQSGGDSSLQCCLINLTDYAATERTRQEEEVYSTAVDLPSCSRSEVVRTAPARQAALAVACK